VVLVIVTQQVVRALQFFAHFDILSMVVAPQFVQSFEDEHLVAVQFVQSFEDKLLMVNSNIQLLLISAHLVESQYFNPVDKEFLMAIRILTNEYIQYFAGRPKGRVACPPTQKFPRVGC